jgi:hypothetical protein
MLFPIILCDPWKFALCSLELEGHYFNVVLELEIALGSRMLEKSLLQKESKVGMRWASGAL